MCGIAGCWPTPPRELNSDAVLGALAHRGPDGRGTYTDVASGVVLVHTRLAIIDISEAGHQPMTSRDGAVTLTFNGEIYNYRELAAELAAGGVALRGHSDTEVLLELYLRDGMAMLPRLNGMFAFAIHDTRSGELLLARDGPGVKPLYVCEDADGFAFASEIKALLPWRRADATLDLPALQRYATFLWCPGTGTPLANVRKLAPGSAMVVKDGRIAREWRWYALPVSHGLEEGGSRTGALLRQQETTDHDVPAPNGNRRSQPVGDGDWVSAVRESLRTAVQRQLVADVPVGAFLSGGLDSSAIVAFAREQAPDIRCFTIEQTGGGDAGDADDLPYAQRVAKHLGVQLDVVRIDAAQMASDLADMVWQLDEPLADPAPLNVLYISRLARQHGIKVLLSGAGGDDLYAGYRRHVALQYERWWNWLPSPVASVAGKLAGRLDQRSGFGRRVGRLLSDIGATGDAGLARYFAWTRRKDLLALLSDDFRREVADIAPAQPMLDYLATLPAETSRLQRMLALEQRFFLADHNLIYTDKMAMVAGVEVRVPFLDPDLMQLAARIPDRLLQHGRTGKWVLKRAMEPYLPHDVIYRPKTGFGAPLRRWMRHDLRGLLGDVLSEASLRRRGLFDAAAVQRLIADNDAGRVDAAYTLLSLLCIEIWCRRFVDANSL